MSNNLNSILAFIPQNNEGELVLKEALYFQQTLGMRIFVLNVIKAPSLFSRKFQAKNVESIENEAVQKLNNFVKNVIQKEIPKNIILRVKPGNVVPTLIEESQRGGYGFIVVDKSKSSFKGALHWNKIDKFISQSHCPVLAVNKDFPVREIKKIVIPIDISQSMKKRLLWATLFAKKFGAKIQIVSALNINIDEKKSLAFKNAEKIKHLFWDQGIECEVKILKVHKQKKYKAILKCLKEEKPELVIIRTHQESIFSGNKIGKFVSKIVHGCNMPVFTVNYSQNPLDSIFF
ncbi:MAG: universal stress protein [Draconibacterium sp.]|nr:universal stress protein [Draconibacterium sp.]